MVWDWYIDTNYYVYRNYILDESPCLHYSVPNTVDGSGNDDNGIQ